MNRLDEMQEGIIKEIGNVGAGHIMMSLSKQTKVNTDMDVTRVYEFTREQFNTIRGYLTEKKYAVSYKFDGTCLGGFLLVFPKDIEQKVIVSMRSTSSNIFNNFTTAYSNSLKEYLGIECKLKFHKWLEKNGSELLSDVFTNSFDEVNTLIMVDTRFSMGPTKMTGHTFLYFDAKDYNNIMSIMAKKIQEMVG